MRTDPLANVGTEHPWLVIETWGTPGIEPTGCWTEAAAVALASRLSSGWGHGRYKAVLTSDYLAATSTASHRQ